MLALSAVRSRRFLLGLTLLLAIALSGWVWHRWHFHPEFGRYHSASMSESHQKSLAAQTRSQKLVRSIRERLKLPVPRPQSKNGYDWGIPFGATELGWSVSDNAPTNRTGYIYMRNVNPAGNNQPLWEFALSPKRSLTDVTREDLPEEYYGMNDPRGPFVYGAAWTEAALKVPEGQVFFARQVTNQSAVYIVHLRKQGGGPDWGTIEADYVVTYQAGHH